MKPLDLIEHPEGGRFREVFRSACTVLRADGTQRASLTHIYFSLAPGEVSKFHKVASNEVWNLYQGAGIKLYTWDGGDAPPVSTILSAAENRFCHVVPAGVWQAAVPLSDTVLVGCSVAPGFEFADFALMEGRMAEAGRLLALVPGMAQFIHDLA